MLELNMNDLPVQDGLIRIDFDVDENDFLSAMGLDQAEALMMEHGEPVECPVEHLFFPKLYVRSFTAPAGALVTSRIHRTEHPFIILRGDVSIWVEGVGTIRYKGPYHGRTHPGTRRLLFFHSETVIQTFHVRDDYETLEEIEERILEPYYNFHTGMYHSDMSRLSPSFMGEVQKIQNHDQLVLHPE